MTASTKKNEFLGTLGANLPQHVSLPVVRAIVDSVDPILGVASAKYEKYAEVSAAGLRTVARTIPALHAYGLLRKQARRDGPPVLWLPEIMDMQADEALRRAAWLTHHKDENPQNYFAAGNAKLTEGASARRAKERSCDEAGFEGEPKTRIAPNSSLSAGRKPDLPKQGRAKLKSPAYANDPEILRLVYGECDARGVTPEDPEALSIAIHALGNSRAERFRHLDGRALRKAFQRARARLPDGYDRWARLIEKWDESYDCQKSRDLVDRLVTAVGNRPLGVLDDLFDHLEQQICDHWPKKVRRLELEYNLLQSRKYYLPQLRSLKTDAIKEQVYAALAEGAKTKKALARQFGKTIYAISSVGLRLRNEGKITTIWRGGQFMWARPSTAPRFIPARDSILAALKIGSMTIPKLARETGKGTSTVKSALHRHLLPNGEVIRTKLGTYALAGTKPRYVSKCEGILAALKNGPLSFQELVREVGITALSLPQFLERLRAKGEIIRTKKGIYALPGMARVYVPTDDAIISALAKKPMKLGPLVRHINESTRSRRSRGTVTTVLGRLKNERTVKQDRRGGEYRLARPLDQIRQEQSVRGGRIIKSSRTRRGRGLFGQDHCQRAAKPHLPPNAVHAALHKRAVRMINLRRNGGGNYSSRRCIPYDVRAEHARLYGPRSELKFSAPASVGSAEARRRFRKWDAEITGRFEAIRTTKRSEA